MHVRGLPDSRPTEFTRDLGGVLIGGVFCVEQMNYFVSAAGDNSVYQVVR